MIPYLIGMLIGVVLLRFRWAFTAFFAVGTILLSYTGNVWMFPCALMFAAEFVSAWAGETWTMVMWRILRPNPIERLQRVTEMQTWLGDLSPGQKELLQEMNRRRMARMSPAWKAVFERARKRDVRRIK